MMLQDIIETVIVFLFLITFAIDDLQTRRIKNKKTAKFFIVVVALILVHYDRLDMTWATESVLCVVAVFLMFRPVGIFGGADMKIISILSMLYGPVAVYYGLMSILAGHIWKKGFVHDGYDRFLKMEWEGIPVMFFYLFVFTFFKIVLGSIRLVQ